jgi:uncharacterized protein YdcH (DUF465 family)
MKKHDEFVERHMKEDVEFKRSYKAHRDYEDKIAQIDKKKHLTPGDEVERNRLKKLKLALKDGMEKKLAAYREKNA